MARGLALDTRNDSFAGQPLAKGKAMRLIKGASCFLILTFSHTSNAQTLGEINQYADLMVRLCIAGGRSESTSGGGSGDADLSIRSLDMKGKVEGNFRITKSNAEGLVNGIDSALNRVAADEADKVRDCLKPVRERVLEIILPLPHPPPKQPSSTNGSSSNHTTPEKEQKNAAVSIDPHQRSATPNKNWNGTTDADDLKSKALKLLSNNSCTIYDDGITMSSVSSSRFDGAIFSYKITTYKNGERSDDFIRIPLENVTVAEGQSKDNVMYVILQSDARDKSSIGSSYNGTVRFWCNQVEHTSVHCIKWYIVDKEGRTDGQTSNESYPVCFTSQTESIAAFKTLKAAR